MAVSTAEKAVRTPPPSGGFVGDDLKTADGVETLLLSGDVHVVDSSGEPVLADAHPIDFSSPKQRLLRRGEMHGNLDDSRRSAAPTQHGVLTQNATGEGVTTFPARAVRLDPAWLLPAPLEVRALEREIERLSLQVKVTRDERDAIIEATRSQIEREAEERIASCKAIHDAAKMQFSLERQALTEKVDALEADLAPVRHLPGVVMKLRDQLELMAAREQQMQLTKAAERRRIEAEVEGRYEPLRSKLSRSEQDKAKLVVLVEQLSQHLSLLAEERDCKVAEVQQRLESSELRKEHAESRTKNEELERLLAESRRVNRALLLQLDDREKTIVKMKERHDAEVRKLKEEMEIAASGNSETLAQYQRQLGALQRQLHEALSHNEELILKGVQNDAEKRSTELAECDLDARIAPPVVPQPR